MNNIYFKNCVTTFEFHIAKSIRKKYEFDENLFSITGNVIFANFNAVRIFVQKINSKRDINNNIRPGEVNAIGLLDEIFHFLLHEYYSKENPGVFSRAVDSLRTNLGSESLNKMLLEFIDLFPPMDVYRGKLSNSGYLKGSTKGKPNSEIVVEELLLFYFANFNPAGKRIKELYDENYLSNINLYKSTIEKLDEFFLKEKPFGPDNQDLFNFFKTPILAYPDNLEDQLEFIQNKWKVLIKSIYLNKILSSKDLMKEDITFGMMGGGGAPSAAPSYKGSVDLSDILVLGKSKYKYAADSLKDYDEPEQFTADTEWMPSVILLAKNIYVWLDQLSKKYSREIKTLDQIPDEELDQLVRWNFTGLWLIGVWERSTASRRIKHIMGNIDAVSSAYSLYDYQIAYDIGGEEAYNNLNERAKARGLRLASDMVPNHTGIYSDWVINHPDYFIQSDYPPFPNYKFTGENLSEDPRIQLRIEDGYYQHADAAVVFQRIDNNTGEVKYIYHGNDGTNMPWNDTAQLNYLKKEVREAVIEKIFSVARKFSIIRFDAAMTLTKRHYSRLWFPQPGQGGDIPSRTDYSLTREQFDELFPEEFWREVVDRINNEMPHTLLLAEAFWLMEGYFVRTLGMHRVYNSAFMNMLMREENEKYRDLITNTLEFEPEILKRYVNFMSNPDEETSIKQFGMDDKYFGVATLMITLPGLPMFAHGQIEGYTEKYGMEYKRAYYNESPNGWLVERHQREIFPIMKKRYLFSDVGNFWLFDFFNDHGGINEDVFAYTNLFHNERALVFYNNKYRSTKGRIFQSTPKLVQLNETDKELVTKTLAEALNIVADDYHIYIYREHVSNLEYIRSGKDIAYNGFEIELNGFEYRVFIDFREVYDKDNKYHKLISKIGSSSVPSIERALAEMDLEKVHTAFQNLFDDKVLNSFIEFAVKMKTGEEDHIKIIKNKYQLLLKEVRDHFSLKTKLKPIALNFIVNINAILKLNSLVDENYKKSKNLENINITRSITISMQSNYKENSLIFLTLCAILHLEEILGESRHINHQTFIEDLLLTTPLKNIMMHLGRGEHEIFEEITLINILLQFIPEIIESMNAKWIDVKKTSKDKIHLSFDNKEIFLEMFDNEFVKTFLGVNYFEGNWYYSKEKYEELLNWIFTLSLVNIFKNIEEEEIKNKKFKTDIRKQMNTIYKSFDKFTGYAKKSKYNLDTLKSMLLASDEHTVSEK